MSASLAENIFKNIPLNSKDEIIDILAESGTVRIEKIVSTGQVSPSGFFYDQDENEFVILLKGRAVLSYEDGKKIEFSEGDFVDIPAHLRHRVDFTSNPAVWLAVFY